jgi:hypothetical protein
MSQSSCLTPTMTWLARSRIHSQGAMLGGDPVTEQDDRTTFVQSKGSLENANPETRKPSSLSARPCPYAAGERRRALRRPWSISSGLLAWTSVSWKAAGSSSSRTRG